MKTTVEIADDLLKRAKKVAAERGTTLRDLIESGIRIELKRDLDTGFVLTDASFGGNGIQPGLEEGDWAAIRGFVYDGRGG